MTHLPPTLTRSLKKSDTTRILALPNEARELTGYVRRDSAPMIPYQPKVLVVDDDKNILSAFEDFFRREHCAVTLESNAEQALKKIKAEHFHLLISDIRLDKQSGMLLVRNSKRIRPKLPVIVITGFPDLFTEKDARQCGADYFLLKPLELSKLQEVVRACLDRRDK